MFFFLVTGLIIARTTSQQNRLHSFETSAFGSGTEIHMIWDNVFVFSNQKLQLVEALRLERNSAKDDIKSRLPIGCDRQRLPAFRQVDL